MSAKHNLEIQRIKEDFKRGVPIFIFDDSKREGETDIFFYAESISPSSINFLRKEGGGMIFLASEYSLSNKIGLPFAQDIFEQFIRTSSDFDHFKTMLKHSIPYDSRSSFSIFINHKNTFTGITDKDRSLTVSSFFRIIKESTNLSVRDSRKLLSNNFRIPGHVPICIADSKLLQARRGHTELVVAIMELANLVPVAVGCEMLSNNGNSLNYSEAKSFARERGYLFLEGRSIVEACL